MSQDQPPVRRPEGGVLLGRGAELAYIHALLTQARSGTTGSLVIRGEPGIGKTTLLRHVTGSARDMTVLTATGVEAESDLPFAGLSELLRPILGRLGEIPPHQAGALAGALAAGPPVAQDRFTISVATLSLLAAAAERQPVLVAVDDAHWLDASSRDALLFAARRLQADRTALIFTARIGEPVTFEAPAAMEIVLGGVNQEACDALLAGSGAAQVSPAVSRRILEATAGNPLAIKEAPRVLSPAQLAGSERLAEPLPVGAGVQRSFARRVARLPRPTQIALLVVAASRSAEIDEVRRACEALDVEPEALEHAEREGLIEKDGVRVRFAHPLMRATVYHRAPAPERRSAHRALASVLEGEARASERAWHLAAAADGVDEEVASALEEAGRQARERSGHASAASAFERSALLTPESELRARRLLEAGTDAHVAGESDWALRLLREALSHARSVALRADVEHARGRVEMWTRSPVAAREILLAAADAIEPHDAGRAAMILCDAATTCYMEGDPDHGVLLPALDICHRAHALSKIEGGTTEAAACGLLGKTLTILGHVSEGHPLLVRCHEAISESNPLWLTFQLIQAVIVFLWLEDYNRARRPLEQLIARARASSAPGALLFPLCNLAEVEFRMGRWSEAHAAAAEATQLAQELGQIVTLVYALCCLGWVEAAMGREGDCRSHIAAALDIAGPRRTTIAGYALSALGLLELGLGHSQASIHHLRQLSDRMAREEPMMVEHAVFQYMPDLIEAYARTGARAEAEMALAGFSTYVIGSNGTWGKAAAARCRGLLSEVDFDQHFQEAIRLHNLTPTPFERARTELCYGERLRRAKRRAESRSQLRSALGTFERVGAEPWADRARHELDTTGLTVERRVRLGSEALTPQELQVALRVAKGAMNREVAADLFMSPKTVEAHLSRIYSKLSVRSRTELANHLRTQGP